MKEKLNKFLEHRNQTSLLLWLIVGGYLVYQAYQILTSDMGDANPTLLWIFSIVFIIAGAAIVALSLYAFIGGHYLKPQFPADDDGEDTQE